MEGLKEAWPRGHVTMTASKVEEHMVGQKVCDVQGALKPFEFCLAPKIKAQLLTASVVVTTVHSNNVAFSMPFLNPAAP